MSAARAQVTTARSVAQITNILADQPKQYAIYVFYYDQVNNWFAEKGNVPLAFASLVGSFR